MSIVSLPEKSTIWDRPLKWTIRFLVDTDQTGLMSGFILQAIEQFAIEVAEADAEEIIRATNGFVNGQAWIECAQQILAEFEPAETEDAA